MSDDEILDRLKRIHTELLKLVADSEPEMIDDYIFSEQEEKAWFEAEHDFTKRIATPLPTKQRRRVTLRKVTLP
jgi:hypothetical protein